MTGKITRLTAALGGSGLVLAAGVAQAAPQPARCSSMQQTIAASGTPVPLSDLSVTTVTTLDDVAVVFLTADICVAQHAEVRVAYSIDGGDPQVLGPTNLANHLRYCATRATMAVVPLPDSHAHTITPYWLVSGAPGKRATFVSGCLASQRELIIP